MSWFAVYRNSDGVLVSTGTVLGQSLDPSLTSIDFGTPQVGVWNVVTHIFDPAPPVLVPIISLGAFVKRFTIAEREALENILATGTQTQKNKLNAFRQYLSDLGVCDLNDTYIQASVNLMETAGIIAVGRAAAILTIGVAS